MDKLFIFTLLMLSLNTSQAEETVAPTSRAALREEDQQILNSEQFADCREQVGTSEDNLEERNRLIRDCVQAKLNETDQQPPSQTEGEEQIDLANIRNEESQTSKDMSEFLSRRFEEKVHGDDTNSNAEGLQNTRKRKHVNQVTYFKIYKAQLEKNVLLEYSKYCLENLRDTTDQYKLFSPKCSDMQNWTDCALTSAQVEAIQQGRINPTPPQAQNYGDALARRLANSNTQEVEYNPNAQLSSQQQPAASTDNDATAAAESDANNSTAIRQRAQVEFQRGPVYLENKYNLCLRVIPVLCKQYECKNSNINSPQAIDECKKALGDPNWTPPTNTQISQPADTQPADGERIRLQEQEQKGRIACVVKGRIKNYRDRLAEVDRITAKIKEFNDQNGNRGGSIDVMSAYKGEYFESGGDGSATIGELTTIASSEITSGENIESFANSEDLARQLEECREVTNLENASEVCRQALMTEQSQRDIEIEFETATAAEDQRLRTLANDQERLEQYLEANGMQTDLENLRNDRITKEALADIIANRFRVERTSLLRRLSDEFDSRSERADNSTNPDANNIESAVNRSQSEVLEQQERLGAVIQYNNIISSFLKVETEDPNGGQVETSRNSESFLIERNQFEQSGNTDQEMTAFFNDVGQEFEGQNSNGSVTLAVEQIDQLLGNRRGSEEENQQ